MKNLRLDRTVAGPRPLVRKLVIKLEALHFRVIRPANFLQLRDLRIEIPRHTNQPCPTHPVLFILSQPFIVGNGSIIVFRKYMDADSIQREKSIERKFLELMP